MRPPPRHNNIIISRPSACPSDCLSAGRCQPACLPVCNRETEIFRCMRASTKKRQQPACLRRFKSGWHCFIGIEQQEAPQRPNEKKRKDIYMQNCRHFTRQNVIKSGPVHSLPGPITARKLLVRSFITLPEPISTAEMPTPKRPGAAPWLKRTVAINRPQLCHFLRFQLLRRLAGRLAFRRPEEK